MNKSLLVGLIGGIGIATAGGVAGYAFMSKPVDVAAGSAAIESVGDAAASESSGSAGTASPAVAQSESGRAVAVTAAATATRPVATATQQPAAAAAGPVEECWDEVVEVQAAPRDEKAIAGTATGAILGGAIAKRLGDDNDLVTAAGAAAGALAGRKLQRRVQENNTTTTVERRCAPAR